MTHIDYTQPMLVDVNSLYVHFTKLEDKRKARGIRYPLAALMTLILLAKLGGQDTVRGIVEWLRHRMHYLAQAVQLGRQTVPHYTTISRNMSQSVDPQAFDEMVGAYFSQLQVLSATIACAMQCPTGHRWIVIAFDGKTLCGTIPTGAYQGYHLLAAYGPEFGLVLAQLPVDKKANEIVVAPQLLAMIDLQGKVVTGDALHTQRKLSIQIVEAGGHYNWTVKANQPRLYNDLMRLFTPPLLRPGFSAPPTDFRTASTRNYGHGRLEIRTLTASSMLNDYVDWPYLGQVYQLERQVINPNTGEIKRQTVYGITDLSQAQADPTDLLFINRAHWGIENGLHYRRDVTLKEDDCRLQVDQAQHVMATFNNLALGLMMTDGVEGETIPDKRVRYCADPLKALKRIMSSPRESP